MTILLLVNLKLPMHILAVTLNLVEIHRVMSKNLLKFYRN